MSPPKKTNYVTYPTKLILAFRSGDRCAFPNCDQTLSIDGTQLNQAMIGEAAHIAGEKVIAARYDPSMTDEQRNHYNNLIYLCRNHHSQIDKLEDEFSVSRLLEMKAEHEKKVRESITEGFANVGFPELAEATEWISQISQGQFSQDFSLIPPEDKLQKNKLSNDSRFIITMGLSVAREVKAYVETVSQTESDFPERLKAGFLEEYYRLKREGYSGDELFNLICCFTQRGFKEPSKRSAGLAVLAYLFETCDVFEK